MAGEQQYQCKPAISRLTETLATTEVHSKAEPFRPRTVSEMELDPSSRLDSSACGLQSLGSCLGLCGASTKTTKQSETTNKVFEKGELRVCSKQNQKLTKRCKVEKDNQKRRAHAKIMRRASRTREQAPDRSKRKPACDGELAAETVPAFSFCGWVGRCFERGNLRAAERYIVPKTVPVTLGAQQWQVIVFAHCAVVYASH